MTIFTARVGDQTYPCTVSNQALNSLRIFLSTFQRSSILVIIDKCFESLTSDYSDELKDIVGNYSTLYIDGGLRSKGIRGYETVINWVSNQSLPRDGVLVAVGGGVIGDLVAFVASTYLRGVSLIHVPTTTTSMIDSSIGGKTGINHAGQVNLIGTYYNPEATFADTRFLSTLEDRDYKAGICEAIKMATTSDKSFAQNFLNDDSVNKYQERDIAWLEEIVTWSIKTKLSHVSDDAKEKGTRLVLNYGHTFGQSIESFYGVDQDFLRHGEAVALGMMCAAKASALRENSPSTLECLDYTKAVLSKYDLPTSIKKLGINALPPRKALTQNLINDKKRTSQGNRFILLKSLGDAEICYLNDEALLASAFDIIL